MLDSLLALDRHLFLILNRDLANPAFDLFFPAITQFIWVLPVGAAILVFFRVGRKEALLLAFLAVCTVALTDQLGGNVVKPLVGRLRPCDPMSLVEGGRFLLGCGKMFSFPSNHAVNVFGQAMLITLLYPRHGLLVFSFAALIGYSRIYVGVHYPLDILGGAVLGVLCAAAVFSVYRAIRPRFTTEHAQSTEEVRGTAEK